VSLLCKEGVFTYFVWGDNYFFHAAGDKASFRFIVATLLVNGLVRACEMEGAPLCVAHRTLMNWERRLREQGPGSFFVPVRRSGGRVLTPEKVAQCERGFAQGLGIREVAARAGIAESTLRKAVHRGCVRAADDAPAAVAGGNTKSERSRADADAALGLGTACTRADERVAAAMGLAGCATARFEVCQDVALGGLLAGLPALCANGLLSGIGKYLKLPQGFYSCLHILLVLGFMALGRIRRPEGLRHVPPGEFGKVVGLHRAPARHEGHRGPHVRPMEPGKLLCLYDATL
jgi:hypothetical protein